MAATELVTFLRWWQRALKGLAALAGGLLAGQAAQATDLPEDKAEALVHVYDGGGTRASGPALLVRKNVADKVSLNASYYVDMVSNASIDVVTTASPYKETRNEVALGADYAVRDSLLSVTTSTSREPDYQANAFGLDVTQETFGGMTTVALGFTRGADKVGRHGEAGFFDEARHWRYRVGATQILTPRWLASANLEVVSDDGYLGSPYRVARVFGAAVPERMPRTRTSRALKFGVTGEAFPGWGVHADYRYFWDTWGVLAHTMELGTTRHFGPLWLGEAYLRYYTQGKALFYSDNAPAETTYVTRNRQLSTFHDAGVGVKATWTVKSAPGRYEVKLHGVYELTQFNFDDFTDLRTGSLYAYKANVLQAYLSATF